MVSINSFSAASKSDFSLFLISVADFRSASFVPISEESSSIFVESDSWSLTAFSMVAVCSSWAAFAVLIENCFSFEASSHHSKYSS